MTISIRNAIAKDVDQISLLIDRSVRALSVGYYSEVEIERALDRVFGVDSQLISDGTFYVAVDESLIVGCGGWSKRRTLYGGDQFSERIDDELDPQLDPARIRAFFVDPAYTRRGIGTSILAECEAAAMRAGFTRAEMGATLPGVPLYSALGYTGDEVIDIDLGEGHYLRCIRMEKRLGPK